MEMKWFVLFNESGKPVSRVWAKNKRKACDRYNHYNRTSFSPASMKFQQFTQDEWDSYLKVMDRLYPEPVEDLWADWKWK